MDHRVFRWVIIENIVTTVSTAFLVSVLFWMSGSFYSLFGLFMLMGLTGYKTRTQDPESN